jgi:metal-responsive CopG/Arc/MetJ family transcriptional regulator
MAKSSAKKRVGRPPTGKNPQVIVRISKQLLAAIDELARKQTTTRSEIMRQLMTEALETRRKAR